MSVHTIRLAGPWERSAEGAEPVRVSLPCELAAGDAPCELTRKFHRPTGLTDSCRVCVVLTVSQTSLDVRVNECPLAAAGSRSRAAWTELTFDVTSMLEPFNTLSICVSDGRPLQVHLATLQIHELS